MRLVHASIYAHLPDIHSLKGRRNIARSLTESLRKKNLSILEIPATQSQELELNVAYLAADDRQAKQILRNIEEALYTRFPQYEWEIDSEMF